MEQKILDFAYTRLETDLSVGTGKQNLPACLNMLQNPRSI